MSDLEKIVVSKTPLEFEINFQGSVYKFKMKRLPWLKENSILSKATIYDGKGTAKINTDMWYEEYLVEALVEAPWPVEQSRFILRSLHPAFGTKLEEKLPKPGGTIEEELDFFESESSESSVG